MGSSLPSRTQNRSYYRYGGPRVFINFRPMSGHSCHKAEFALCFTATGSGTGQIFRDVFIPIHHQVFQTQEHDCRSLISRAS